MAQPWETLDVVETEEGPLALKCRGDRDFLILINGRVLMNSSANRSEIVLAEEACAPIAARKNARVLIGGLGMGYTLRAALDALREDARVTVADLNPVVAEWCRGPLASLTDGAVTDPRVSLEIKDVSQIITDASHAPGDAQGHYDAIILDLYEGPHTGTHKKDDPLYGSRAIERTRAALRPSGIFAVWAEDPCKAFPKRLAAAGFVVREERPGRGGRRHVVYLAEALEGARSRRGRR